MEEVKDQLLVLPNELIGDVLSLLPFRSIVSFASINKQHRERFSRQGGLWQQIVCKLYHWGAKDVDSIHGRIDWNKEFRVSSFFGEQIRNNKLKFDESNDAAVALTIEKENNVTYSSPTVGSNSGPLRSNLTLQSVTQLYPLPWGDFSVAYYEVQYQDYDGQIAIGLALDGYADGIPGAGRNSFAILSDGRILLECGYTPLTVHFKSGDIVGVGINFDAKSVFFTVNGQVVHEAKQNLHGHPLINLKTLHATILPIGERLTFEVNFSSKPFVFDVMEYQRISKKRQSVTYSEKLIEHLTAFSDDETLDAIQLNNFVVSVADYNRPNFPMPQIHPMIYALMYETEPVDSPPIDGVQVVALTRSMLHARDILPKLRESDHFKYHLQMIAAEGGQNIEGRSADELFAMVFGMAYRIFFAWLENTTTVFSTSIQDLAFVTDAPWAVCLLAFKIYRHIGPDNQYVIDLCCTAITGAIKHQMNEPFDHSLRKTFSIEEQGDCLDMMVQLVFASRLPALAEAIQGKLERAMPRKTKDLSLYQELYGGDEKLNGLMHRKMAIASQPGTLKPPGVSKFLPIQMLAHLAEEAFIQPFLCGVYHLDIPTTAAKTREEYIKLVRAKLDALVTPALKKEFLQQMLDEMPKLQTQLQFKDADLMNVLIIPMLKSLEVSLGIKYDQNLASITPEKVEKFLLEQITELDKKENKNETKKKRRAKKKRAAEVSSGMDVQTGLVIAAVTGVIAATVAVAVMFWKRKN